MMNIYSIPDKLEVNWYPDITTVVEIWKNRDVPFEEFRKAVFVKGINHAKASQGRAWIFDGSQSTGSFNAEIQGMIEHDRFAALAWVGAKYYFDVDPAVAEVAPNGDAATTNGVQCLKAPNVDAALAWIRSQA